MSLLALDPLKGSTAPSAPLTAVRHITRLPVSSLPRDLLAAQRQLRDAGSVPELFAQACYAARVWCGFPRSLVVSVQDSWLRDATGMLKDAASEAMRQRLLVDGPVAVRAGTEEYDLIRQAEGHGCGAQRLPSALRGVLGLRHHAIGAVMPEDRVLALVVLDRDTDPVDADDRYSVQVFAQILAAAVERLILRQRMGEFAAELRYLTVSAQALCKEGLEAPVALPVDYGCGPVFAASFPAEQPIGHGGPGQPREPFTRRELTIIEEMVAGRSNREIAAELQLSPETVKKYVARVIHKMGAANRSDAAVRYLRLTSAAR